jgi:two-component system nitrogen regulation response regulator NtrX
MRRTRVLIVDDEPGIRASLGGVLEDEGFEVRSVASGELAIDEISAGAFEAVLLDVWLPGLDGLTVLERLAELRLPDPPSIIMISGHGNIETAVRATKLGAFDFLEKPLTIEKVLVVLKNALEQRRLRTEVRTLRDIARRDSRIIGESVPIKALRQQIALMASTNGRVLIYGESGTGKELVARALHADSPRAEAAFVELNCAAIPEDLIENELFGQRAGLTTDKPGKFEKADGGTLFLRVLDEQRFEPVGSLNPVQVDVRVVASTNKNLEEEIERGNFREDLFYRLNVIPFEVPPLRERAGDIPLLATHFLDDFTSAYGRKAKELTPEAEAVLVDYPWPGNVRELKNLMERIVIMYPQVRIDARHIPLTQNRRPAERAAERTASLLEVRQSAERDYILRKLDDCGGNVSRAAEALGLERSNLYKKMRALGIAPRE